jgi:hypothetical protein
MQGRGDRTADKGAHAQLGEAKRLPDGHVVRHSLFPFGDEPPRLGLGDKDAPGGVEDWSDPAVPVCKGRFHDLLSQPAFTEERSASSVPIRGRTPGKI